MIYGYHSRQHSSKKTFLLSFMDHSPLSWPVTRRGTQIKHKEYSALSLLVLFRTIEIYESILGIYWDIWNPCILQTNKEFAFPEDEAISDTEAIALQLLVSTLFVVKVLGSIAWTIVYKLSFLSNLSISWFSIVPYTFLFHSLIRVGIMSVLFSIDNGYSKTTFIDSMNQYESKNYDSWAKYGLLSTCVHSQQEIVVITLRNDRGKGK